jgi:hypothetical protein
VLVDEHLDRPEDADLHAAASRVSRIGGVRRADDSRPSGKPEQRVRCRRRDAGQGRDSVPTAARGSLAGDRPAEETPCSRFTCRR